MSAEHETISSLLSELVISNPESMVVQLNQDEVKLIRSSFMRIADRLEEIGTASFSELFNYHPEAIKIFVGNRVFPENVNEVKYSWELKGHSLRVMHTFEKIINRLDKPTVWSGMLSDLGCRHACYSAKPAYLPVLVAAFRHAYFQEFQACGIFTPALSAAWYKLFNNMTVLMSASLIARFVEDFRKHKHGGTRPAWLSVETAEAATSSRKSSTASHDSSAVRKCPIPSSSSSPKAKCPFSGTSVEEKSPLDSPTKRNSIIDRVSHMLGRSSPKSKQKDLGITSRSSSGEDIHVDI